MERDAELLHGNNWLVENWSRVHPQGGVKRLFQISSKPIFTTASSVSSCLLSAAHLFWLRSHNLICALCLNKVARVHINSNWCCQCRIIAMVLGALVNIQHGSEPHQLCSSVRFSFTSLVLPQYLSFEDPITFKHKHWWNALRPKQIWHCIRLETWWPVFYTVAFK